MSVVHIRVHGYEYDVACGDGEEDHLRYLADEVDDRVRSLVFGKAGNPGEAMSLLLAALLMADELTDNKQEIKKLVAEANRLAALAQEEKPDRIQEIESAVAVTLEEIALKIEKIADRIEMR